MINVLVNGISGRMGSAIARFIQKQDNINLLGGFDKVANAPERIYSNYEDFKSDFKNIVVIDYSHPDALKDISKFCVKRGYPLMVCTTGLTDYHFELLNEAAKSIPVLQSYNMSLGINVLSMVMENISKLMYDAGFDIEICEKHHNQKLDAPSGTALLLAKAAKKALNDGLDLVTSRDQRRCTRDHDELGISSIRGGTMFGEHEVFYLGQDEVVELKHTAYSRDIFVKGSLVAASFLLKAGPGLYTMRDVLS